MELKRTTIDFDSHFFKIVQKVLLQVKYPQPEITIAVPNQDRSQKLKQPTQDKYKFIFDYPEDNNDVTGIEIFRIVEDL